MRLRGLRVLLVEDDVDNLELLASFLEGEGAHTISAGSIAAALEQTEGQQIDLVVSDLELADGDGCGLLAALRQRDEKPDLPAIAVTGYSEQKWRKKSEGCGFARFAVKPFSLELLVKWMLELSAPTRAGANADFCPVVPILAARGRLAR